MTLEQAKEEMPDYDSFKSELCGCWCKCDWYCPDECDVLTKARKIPFEKIQQAYARHDGDMVKVVRYIRNKREQQGGTR